MLHYLTMFCTEILHSKELRASFEESNPMLTIKTVLKKIKSHYSMGKDFIYRGALSSSKFGVRLKG